MRLAAVAAMTVVLAGVGVIRTPAIARADACFDANSGASLPVNSGPCADVLAQEARWLKAITDGDRATIESILSANYRHTTDDGRLLDRTAEINDTKMLLLTMTPTEQTVDLAGDIAVVHGLNTLDLGSRGLLRKRFTDVFILQNGTWMALSAQETAV
jgi:Domain of unknown function (DUF4440)